MSVSKPNHFSGREYVSVAVLDYINRVAVIWMTISRRDLKKKKKIFILILFSCILCLCIYRYETLVFFIKY